MPDSYTPFARPHPKEGAVLAGPGTNHRGCCRPVGEQPHPGFTLSDGRVWHTPWRTRGTSQTNPPTPPINGRCRREVETCRKAFLPFCAIFGAAPLLLTCVLSVSSRRIPAARKMRPVPSDSNVPANVLLTKVSPHLTIVSPPLYQIVSPQCLRISIIFRSFFHLGLTQPPLKSTSLPQPPFSHASLPARHVSHLFSTTQGARVGCYSG